LVSLALGLASTVPAIRPDAWDRLSSGVVIGIAFVLSLYVWLVFMVYSGRNWARWVVVIFLAFGWVSDFADPKWLTQSMIAQLADLVTTALEVYACFVLLRGQGAAWFKKPCVSAQA